MLTSAKVGKQQMKGEKNLSPITCAETIKTERQLRKAGQFSGRLFWATELASACVLSTLTTALLDTVRDTIIQDLPV